ncbi:MAG: hypothetical protein CM15mV59_0090 [Caudoviricetes sp.]|nr:MAG: hypothetical protein CM15mV59_0090 [Caudoviricetes sp.]
MWKKYWKFNDWVAKKVLGEEVDSLKEFEEVPKRWKRLRKEPFKYIKTTGKEIFVTNLRHAYKVYKLFKKF